ncbi:hypothetical protein ACFX2I_023505 [Malus domestica]
MRRFCVKQGFLIELIWGAATDKSRVYANIANSDLKNFTLKPTNTVTTGGFTGGGWVTMAPGGGKILWSTAYPSNATSPGPVKVANGVLFAGSTNPRGSNADHFYKIHGHTFENTAK